MHMHNVSVSFHTMSWKWPDLDIRQDQTMDSWQKKHICSNRETKSFFFYFKKIHVLDHARSRWQRIRWTTLHDKETINQNKGTKEELFLNRDHRPTTDEALVLLILPKSGCQVNRVKYWKFCWQHCKTESVVVIMYFKKTMRISLWVTHHFQSRYRI